jgi:hypothetical protein
MHAVFHNKCLSDDKLNMDEKFFTLPSITKTVMHTKSSQPITLRNERKLKGLPPPKVSKRCDYLPLLPHETTSHVCTLGKCNNNQNQQKNKTRKTDTNLLKNTPKIWSLESRYTVLPPIGVQSTIKQPKEKLEVTGCNASENSMITKVTRDAVSTEGCTEAKRTVRRSRDENIRPSTKTISSTNNSIAPIEKSTTDDCNKHKKTVNNKRQRKNVSMPKAHRNPLSTCVPIQEEYEKEYSGKMVEYVRCRGRRNAFCKEMDEIYIDLTNTIKYTLIKKYLDTVWV